MKSIIVSLLMLFCTISVKAQVDASQMDKDLEIAENILSTLIQQSYQVQHFKVISNDRDIEGSYVKDYGVVFEVKNSMNLLFYDTENPKVILRKEGVGNGNVLTEDVIEIPEITKIFKTFLADYGDLIHQLSPDDHIMIKTGGQNNSRMLKGLAKVQGQSENYIVEVKKSDLDAYNSGSIDRDALMDRIHVKESVVDLSQEPQLEVFASMLHRLYRTDISNTYYMANAPGYDRTVDYGVKYYVKFYSSQINHDDTHNIPTINKKNLPPSERNKIVNDMYPEFLMGMKQNLLDYGHVLKNLDEDELLILEIELTACEDCEMPSKIELSMKKSVLDQFRRDKVNEAEALDAINVKVLRD